MIHTTYIVVTCIMASSFLVDCNFDFILLNTETEKHKLCNSIKTQFKNILAHFLSSSKSFSNFEVPTLNICSVKYDFNTCQSKECELKFSFDIDTNILYISHVKSGMQFSLSDFDIKNIVVEIIHAEAEAEIKRFKQFFP